MCCRRVLLAAFLVLLSVPSWAANVRLDQNTRAIKAGGVYFATTESEVVNAQSNSAITQVVNTAPWSMTANRTLTKPLRCEGGAIITTTGYTLTLSGGFEAGDYQCFAGTGTVNGLKSANPLWWWAGSGTDDTLSAFNSALSSAKIVEIPDGTYYLSDTLYITGNYKQLIGKNVNAKLYANTISGSLLSVGDGSTTTQFVSVKNLTLAGTATNGLYVDNSQMLTIDNIYAGTATFENTYRFKNTWGSNFSNLSSVGAVDENSETCKSIYI